MQDVYPKTYIRGFTRLEDVVDTMKRVDLQNEMKSKGYSFTYTMEVADECYYLVVIVWKEDAENNRTVG
jgi:negative regulator of genetic competence, sporulation and motility